MPQRKKDRILELEGGIRRHRELYYNQTPEISDAEFDTLEAELRGLAPESAVLSEVGFGVDFSIAGLPTKAHQIPMSSLEKIPEDRLDTWAEKTGPLFLVQEKLDGISMEIEYLKGRIGDAITRGDGLVGEVVTHNAIHFKHVKRDLDVSFTGSIRGEVILRKSVFEEFFVGADFANPRNTVSGTVRKKHGDRSLNRHLEMRFFDVTVAGRDFETEREKMDFLEKELGLELAVTYRDRDIKSVRSIYEDYQGVDGNPGKRFKLDYEIDGLVVRADSIAKQKELGSVRNRPRFATAYKFPSVGQETVLKNVEWSLGIGSRVTPVARLEPVKVGGVTVSNATLHNADYLVSLGLHVGDRVLVERKGDVIPQVVRVVESLGGKKPVVPRDCLTCASRLETRGKHLRCPNPDCPGKSYGDLMRWIREMDIDSLGEKWVGILTANGLLVDPVDLYTLKPEELMPLERMGETLATKVVRNIQESTRPPLDLFVAALNIPEFSRQRAQLLIEAGYDTLVKLQEATVEDLAAVKGFGEILADKAVQGLTARKDLIERLLRVGIRLQKPAEQPERTGPLVGKTFCFTGTIKQVDPASGKTFTRNQMEELVKQSGGRALRAVTAKLDYLVMANPKSRSSKAEKARKLETKILSEEEFFEMLQEP